MPNPTICTMTMNPSIDLSCTAERVVADRKLRCSDPRRDPGGGGINVARVIRRLGGDAVATYPCGGETGQLLGRLLADEGVETQQVEIEGSTREDVAVFERSTGRQFRFNLPGPALSEAEWRRCLEFIVTCVGASDFLVASGSLPPGVPDDWYARVASRLSGNATKIIVDCSGPPLRAAIESGVFLIKPNRRELEDIVGRELTHEDEEHEAATEIVANQGAEVVVVSLGAGGALVVSRRHSLRVHAPGVKARSRVGAGDSMIAGIVLALSRGASLPDAVRLGIAAGAAAVMTPGTELCRAEDVNRLAVQVAFSSGLEDVDDQGTQLAGDSP